MVRLTSLIAALGLVAAANIAGAQTLESPAPAPRAVLDVPYVPQAAALCGGAAIAMVYRYWGDAHAAAEDFLPLVDRRAGGIADTVLIDAVLKHGWRAVRIDGSIESLRAEIAGGRPVVILLEDGPAKYHYLVVTGANADAIVVHDPSWGPSRRIAAADLARAWRPTNFWALVVLPPSHPGTVAPSTLPPVPGTVAPGTLAPIAVPLASDSADCDARTEHAIAVVKSDGLGAADGAFADVMSRCPDSAAPFSELAGVRVAQRRWAEAEKLAASALARDEHDAYAWDVLASSRFVRNDLTGALQAWNQVDKPRLDVVAISGVTHARYELIAETLGLTPNQLLTAEAFARAERRLAALPDRTASRITFEPALDGFATVKATLVEQDLHPRGPIAWSAKAVKSTVNRELDVDLPGPTGQGELWSASWRWWSGRPRVALGFAAPRVAGLPGVWRVDASWESQRYAMAGGARIDETRAHGGLTIGDWLTGHLRYEIGAGLDEWNGARRTASASASLERRLLNDRISIAGSASLFAPVSNGQAFRTADVNASAVTSRAEQPWISVGSIGATVVSAAAPFALWPGAGTGQGRSPLLRAHPLLDDGTIDGLAFGRTLVHATGELQRWRAGTSVIRAGIAAFVDGARATRGLNDASSPWLVDAGIGLRVKLPGTEGTLRADVARGVRDGGMALTIGWQN